LPNASDQRGVIADKCDDASMLFADIAGFTNRASDTTPADLVRFLDRLYIQLDELVELHGLEKIKTSGDSYMVVSGVPQQRPDHVEALASFALDVAAAVANLKDPDGAAPLRIGIGHHRQSRGDRLLQRRVGVLQVVPWPVRHRGRPVGPLWQCTVRSTSDSSLAMYSTCTPAPP
jgi:hypothetical protein